jgi:hypothetical protein
MSDRKPDRPYPGDVLQNPQRYVIRTDSREKTFQCAPLTGTAYDHFGKENLPKNQPEQFGCALIEDGWTELPIDESEAM